MDSGVTPRDIVRQLAKGGGLSVLIKTVNAFLAYLMLLVIARTSTAEHYGVFAVAISVASSAAFFAALGQPWAITRFWPQWAGQNETLKARSIIRLSMALTTTGLGIAASLLLLGSALNLNQPQAWTSGVAVGTALFTVAFGWSEFSSAALRAQGYVVTALAPRDILWRLMVCGIFVGAMLTGVAFSAESILLTIGGVLMIVILPQGIMLYRSSLGAKMLSLSREDLRNFRRYSTIMWLFTTAQLVRANVGVIIVSAFLGAEAAGAYFAADRTANVLSFLLLAINLVSAPLISRHYHSGRTDLVRLIVGLSGLSAGLAALVGLVSFFFFGEKILSFFNPDYGPYLPVLLLLGCSQFLMAATGPVGSVLALSGHERINLIVNVAIGITSVCLQSVGGYYWGAIGVASGAAAGTVIMKAITVTYAWRVLRIDSTGLTLAFRSLRKLSNALLTRLALKR